MREAFEDMNFYERMFFSFSLLFFVVCVLGLGWIPFHAQAEARLLNEVYGTKFRARDILFADDTVSMMVQDVRLGVLRVRKD